MVFRSPLAEFSRGLLFTDKEESCVCTFLATFSSWAIQKAWDAGKGICVKSLYDLLRPLSESTDCWSRLDGSGSETSQSWEVKSPASVSQRRGWGGHTSSLTRSPTVGKSLAQLLSPAGKIRPGAVVISQSIAQHFRQSLGNVVRPERMPRNVLAPSILKKCS